MALKHYLLEIKDLSIDPKIGLKDYSPLYKNGVSFKQVLLHKSVKVDIKSGRTPSRFNEEYWNGDNEFLTMSDVDTSTFSINQQCVDKITDYAIQEEKTLYKTKENSLIISNAMTLGLSFLSDRSVYINQNVFEVSLDENKVNKKFVLWYFNLKIRPLFQNTYAAKYLSKDELGRIKLPNLSKGIQDKIVAQIEPIEEKIKKFKLSIRPQQEVINEVFSKEFGFSKNVFNEFGKGMTAGMQMAQERNLKVFEINFSDLSYSNTLRLSTRYHNIPTKELMDFLDNVDTLYVREILAEPIHRGASPQYNPDGEIPVVKTGHLKNGFIEISNDEFVDSTFYNSSKRYQLREWDVLIASTGKSSLGKIDILETDQELIADGHVTIIRINPLKYNPVFFTYYFRSILGCFQIERDYTGATNQVELYTDEIANFKIPNITLQRQQTIVDEVKGELDRQNVYIENIKNERMKIAEIIQEATK